MQVINHSTPTSHDKKQIKSSNNNNSFAKSFHLHKPTFHDQLLTFPSIKIILLTTHRPMKPVTNY